MPPKKTRSTSQGDLLPGDFTPGQYILGICVALFFGLSCFGLGIVIGRREPAASAAPERPAAAASLVTAKKTEGVQTSPRLPETVSPAANTEPRRPTLPSGTPPAAEPPSTPAGTPASSAPPGTATPTGQGVVVRPGRDGVTVTPQASAPAEPAAAASPASTTPSPAAASSTPAAVASAATTSAAKAAAPTPSSHAAQNAPGATVSATSVAASATKPPPPTATPITPPDDLPKPKPAGSSAAVPAPAPGPAATPVAAAQASGKWGIQVASLSGATRQKGADDLIRRLRETAGLTAQAIPTADGAALRVVVVGFGTREAADRACTELRQKPDFKGAFVKPL